MTRREVYAVSLPQPPGVPPEEMASFIEDALIAHSLGHLAKPFDLNARPVRVRHIKVKKPADLEDTQRDGEPR